MNNPNVASAFGTREEYRGSSNDFLSPDPKESARREKTTKIV